VQDGNANSLNITLRAEHSDSQITATIATKGEAIFNSLDNLDIKFGEKTLQLSEYFNENPPTIFMADTSVIDGGFRYYPNEEYAYLYERNNTEDWDWSGVDISVESQTSDKLETSIQYHTIRQIQDDYDLVFDDDGAGEVADIVAIKNIDDKELTIDLFHCKYCSKKDGIATPGARVDDVYQVAGQAEKSVKWFADKEKLILRLMDRERARLKQSKPSRIDKGRYEDLIHFAKIARYASFKLGIAIVQPAISKMKMSDDQLSILGATAAYIDETSGVKLRVIINK
ncbi:helicase, partial [Vibrio parahaemolyticus]